MMSWYGVDLEAVLGGAELPWSTRDEIRQRVRAAMVAPGPPSKHAQRPNLLRDMNMWRQRFVNGVSVESIARDEDLTRARVHQIVARIQREIDRGWWPRPR